MERDGIRGGSKPKQKTPKTREREGQTLAELKQSRNQLVASVAPLPKSTKEVKMKKRAAERGRFKGKK